MAERRWLKREIETVTSEVASWPDWKRRLATMAPQDDLTTERAAALFRKLDEGLYYMREGGKSHQEQDKFGVDLLLQFAQQTRQDALREAASLIKLMPMLTAHNVAAVLDRLASEGG